MKTLETVLHIHNDANFTYPILKEIFEILFFAAVTTALLAFIFNTFPIKKFTSIILFSKKQIKNMLRSINSLLNDPTEHRLFTHCKHIGKIIGSCLAFLMFLSWFFASLFLAFFNIENNPEFEPLFSAAFTAALFLFTSLFKAETGRSIMFYRNWRNDI